MSAFAELRDRPTLDLPYVEAELHYLSPMKERPRNYTFDPPPGVPRSNTVHENHVVPIYDMRGIESEISIDREGFELPGHVSAVRGFIFDHTVRRRVYGAEDRAVGAPRQPATRVHVDHTAKSGPQRVRDF